MNKHARPAAVSVLAITVALGLAACGGDDSASTSDPAEPTGTASAGDTSADTATSAATSDDTAVASATTAATTDDGDGGSDGGADLAAAEALIAPYTGKPSAFPIDTPLEVSPAGKRIAYLDCGSPICALYAQLGTPAFEALGMELTVLDAGFAADTVQQAFDTVVQEGYDGVLVPALPAALWERGLEQLVEAGIPVVTSGVIGLDPEQVPVQQGGEKLTVRNAELLAGEVVTRNGADSDVVVYHTPELDFTNLTKDVFIDKMAELCPDCPVRAVPIPVASFGTTASDLIVADLQANPDTTTAVFGVGEQSVGLPAALETAGLEIETILNSLGPAQLESLQRGEFDVGLATDFNILVWTTADTLARLTTGQPPAPGAVADDSPGQLLTADDVQGDASRGWSAYPDFADRFAALWADAS